MGVVRRPLSPYLTTEMKTNEIENKAIKAAPQGVKFHRQIKLGIDVHWREYVVVRQIDGAAPQPPQRFAPDAFVGLQGDRKDA